MSTQLYRKQTDQNLQKTDKRALDQFTLEQWIQTYAKEEDEEEEKGKTRRRDPNRRRKMILNDVEVH